MAYVGRDILRIRENSILDISREEALRTTIGLVEKGDNSSIGKYWLENYRKEREFLHQVQSKTRKPIYRVPMECFITLVVVLYVRYSSNCYSCTKV